MPRLNRMIIGQGRYYYKSTDTFNFFSYLDEPRIPLVFTKFRPRYFIQRVDHTSFLILLHPLRPAFWRRFRFCQLLRLGPDELDSLLNLLRESL